MKRHFKSLIVVFISVLLTGVVLAEYLKHSPAPDVDKKEHHGNNKVNSCWMAAASNMLAGAGYGDGNDIQQRADDIYRDMNEHYGNQNCNWADTALNWWLGSANNNWTDNPYSIVTVYGNKDPRYPWANPDLPKFIANKLRGCDMVRISIRKPTCDANVGEGGHAITYWGDSEDANDLTYNPNDVIVTDSDYFNWRQIFQTYEYDDYNNPNPDGFGCDEGDGWYIDYWNATHWYIDNIVTLSPTTDGNTPNTQKAIASLKTLYDPIGDTNATDLHYTILADANIYAYSTTISWETDDEPNVWEDDVEHSILVEWDLSDNPIPPDTNITIYAEVALPYDANGHGLGFNAVLFTPINLQPMPGSLSFGSHAELPGGPDLTGENICGGHTVCSAQVYDDPGGTNKVGEYRWQNEYVYYQNPEDHVFLFDFPEPSTYFIGNFKFGHSYAQLLPDELWAFDQWKSDISGIYSMTAPIGPIPIQWPGELPYPKGQEYDRPLQCGDPGTVYLPADINKDCHTDLKDLAEMATSWLICTDPNDSTCWE